MDRTARRLYRRFSGVCGQTWVMADPELTRLRGEIAAIDRSVLDVEGFTNHRPAVVHLAEPVFVVDAHIAVIHEIRPVAVDGPDALNLDSRRVQRDQEHGEALVFRRIGVGVGDEEDVLTVVGAGGEHL